MRTITNCFCCSLCLLFIGCTSKKNPPDVAPVDHRLELAIAPRTQAGVELSLTAAKIEYAATDAIQMTVTIRNTGQTPIHYYESTPDRDIWLTVDDDNGKRLPLTRLGQHYETRTQWVYTRRIPVTLQAGESREFTVYPNRFYDMTMPEIYRVTAALLIDKEDLLGERVFLRSNIRRLSVSWR